jgi:hypothetical protein
MPGAKVLALLRSGNSLLASQLGIRLKDVGFREEAEVSPLAVLLGQGPETVAIVLGERRKGIQLRRSW